MSGEIVHKRYRIHEKIGQGAVGQVYKAYDLEGQRYVALKTIPAHARDDVVLRFLREAEVTAKLLKHRSVVEVYEFGRDEGKLFIAMELLDGTDLRRLIRSRPPLTVADKLVIMLGICEGVGFAHSKNVVHRDLAPSNIYILANNQIKIMDFGLVHLAESDMTRTGAIMGTPSYMSPEQAEGRKVEAVADVFSLGAVFYELLTYRKAFNADSILSTLFLILNEVPEPIRDLAPDVPASLVELIDKALSKNPDDRFADANALHDALAALVDGLGLSRSSDAPRALLAALTEQSVSAEGAGTQGKQRLAPPWQDHELRGFTGNLKKTPLSVLLSYCSESSKVGALHLRRGPIEKRLFFVGGRLLSTTTNSPRETLGQLLIRSGHLSEDQLRQSLEEQERSREPLGRIVVSKGWLEDTRLKELLREKSEESIYDCFLWPDGEFAFEEGRTPDNVYLSESLDVGSLIHEGERRRRQWRRIRERFPSSLTTFAIVRSSRKESSLDPEQRRFLELVERNRNLAEIALEVHGAEFYVASRMLELLERGLIEIAEVPAAPSYEEQVRELRELLRRGLTHFNAGEHGRALEAFEAALEIDPLSKAYLYVRKIRERLGARGEEAALAIDGVPRLALSAEELERVPLTPEEFFVLSRVGGGWTVGAILQICPMSEEEAKSIFRKLLEKGVLTLSGEVPSQKARR